MKHKTVNSVSMLNNGANLTMATTEHDNAVNFILNEVGHHAGEEAIISVTPQQPLVTVIVFKEKGIPTEDLNEIMEM